MLFLNEHIPHIHNTHSIIPLIVLNAVTDAAAVAVASKTEASNNTMCIFLILF
jgi:hypothetical protein